MSRNDGAGAVNALSDVSLTIAETAFFSVAGLWGRGKTTRLRMLAGVEGPGRGTIVLDGRDIADLPPNRRPITTSFQNDALSSAHDGGAEHRLRAAIAWPVHAGRPAAAGGAWRPRRASCCGTRPSRRCP